MSTIVTYGDTDITWDNSPYTWDDIPIDFTWNNSVLSGYNVLTDYSIYISDSYEKSTISNRFFEETIPLSDSYNKETTKVLTEPLRVKTSFIQNSNSVIYDVSIRSAASYTVNDLRTLAVQAQVAGYEPGVEFLPGDYDFEEAIVGLVITNDTGSKVGFKEIDTYTDTPDIVDRGEIAITNSGENYDPITGFTTVYLNKEFHFVPNVTATVTGGTTLAEPMFDPDGFDKTYFKVKLVERTDGSAVSGSTLVIGGGSTEQTTGILSWKAVGY